MSNALNEALEILETRTPLKTDCGCVCGAACCASHPGEETGMLLFPGEEERYRGAAGFRLRSAAAGTLLVCEGRCERSERPLSCRLFPLLPVLREGEVRVAVDARARAVCPLAAQGLRAMDPAFREAVRAAGQALARDGAQRAMLLRLTREQDEWNALRKRFGREEHV